MYKYQEGSRVKAMREKFENESCFNNFTKINNTSDPKNTTTTVIRNNILTEKNKQELHVKSHPIFYKPYNTLSKHADSPGKRNVKRSPAFRFDSHPMGEKGVCLSQNRIKYLDKRRTFVQQNEKDVCDSEFSFKYKPVTVCDESQNSYSSDVKEKSVSSTPVYAEAIPKHLRLHENERGPPVSNNADSESYLENKTLNTELENCSNNQNKHSLKLDVKDTSVEVNNSVIFNGLTDTLKTALKRPLPAGPAPEKPPRLFTHLPKKDCDIQNNLDNTDSAFKKKVDLDLGFSSIKKGPRGDPIYMLEKLERTLMNNKAHLKCKKKKQQLSVYNYNKAAMNSYQSKTNSVNFNDNDIGEIKQQLSSLCFNFNSLNLCGDLLQKKVKEKTLANNKKEEPIYAETFQFNKFPSNGNLQTNTNNKYEENKSEAKGLANKSNSVHYDVTSLIDTTTAYLYSRVPQMEPENKVKEIINVFESIPKQSADGYSKSSEINSNSSKTKDPAEKLEILENRVKGGFDTSPYSTRSSLTSKHESVTEITKKFETYVKGVRSKIYSEPFKPDSYKHLFHCCLLVGLNGNVPYIRSKFPDNIELPHNIEELCFPDAQAGSMDLTEAAQCYSLVITNSKGERTFGYCRRILPEGSTTCLPMAYCILSHHSAPGFYKKILKELESSHGFSEKFKTILLNELYSSRFPRPGEMVKIRIGKAVEDIISNKNNSEAINDNITTNLEEKKSEIDFNFYSVTDRLGEYATVERKHDNEEKQMSASESTSDIQRQTSPSLCYEESVGFPSELTFVRPSDSRHEENNLQTLYHSLSTNILQQVFSSLLLERKVVIISNVLSKISSCIEALQVTLYPFSWPHTLIPVLPRCLWEIVEAPTPLLCGVLSKEIINLYKIENAIVVDLDDRSVLLKVGDEDKILRWTLLDIWKDGLSLAKSIPCHEVAQNVLLSDAFLRVFIKSCGHYKDHIVSGQFQKMPFIESGKLRGKGIRNFLTWFVETTMFHIFIDTVLTDIDSFRVFDQRIEIYSSGATEDIIKKMKETSKEKNTFFKLS